MSILRRLRERTGVRAASALAAATAVAMVLVVAGVALVLLLDRTLQNNTRDALGQNAQQLATRVEANFSSSGDPKRNAIDATGKRTDIVQVVTAYSDETNAPDWMVGSNGDGEDVQVIGSSDPLDQEEPLVGWLLAPGETRSESDVPVTYRNGADRAGADELKTEKMMVVGLGARAQGRPITVYAAQDLGPMHQAVETVGLMVAVGVPLLVLVAGFFTYLFAGRALRPVEDMRTRVAGMGERDLSARVPEPASRDEVGRLARTMNQMLGRIESSQITQRRFVADASHELRSPLATVSTGLELLGRGMPEDSADRATVETLRGEAGRLTGLVEGLLFLARADERGLTPRREEVDLDEIVDAERVRPSGDDAVVVRVGTEPVRVVGDRGQLVRVVRNLVDNAKRHASSEVSVSVRVADGVAVIDVDDDGHGVPEADRARVFERFVRLDEARARGDGGSGLGLSIVAELVAAHGGTVAALESPELGGARFRVTVPAVSAPVPETEDDPASVAPSAAGQAPESGDAPATGGTGPQPRVAATGATGATGATAATAATAATGATAATRATAATGATSATRATAATGATAAAPGVPAAPGAPEPGAAPASDAGATPVPGPGWSAVPVSAQGPGPGGPPAPDAVPDPGPAPAGSTRGPDTGPLPIRPDTVRSPFDDNATRPLPVVRDDGPGGRSRAAGPAGSAGHGGRGGHGAPGTARPAGTGIRPTMSRTDRTRQEPARRDPARQDSARRDPAGQDAARQDAVGRDTAWQDPARQDPARQDPARQDAAQRDTARQDAVGRDTAWQDPAWRDLVRQGPARAATSRPDPDGAQSAPRTPGGRPPMQRGPADRRR